MGANPNPLEAVLGFIETCESLENVQSLLNQLMSAARDVGFTSFIVTGLPLPNRPMEPLILGHCWPDGWSERYLSQDYFHIDPVGQHALVTSAPFRWAEAPYRKEPDRAHRVMAEAGEFGLKDGLVVPIHTATGWQSAFGFASEHKLRLNRKEVAMAHLLAITAHERLRSLLGEQRMEGAKLTPREREVLAWAAAGKSAWEASSILGISEATVITHLENIRRKLNVANTTQAVVVALQTGELQPY